MLQSGTNHVAGLLLYAKACVALQQYDGALQSLLRVIVLSSKHKAARRALADSLGTPSGLALLELQLPFTIEAAPALAFLAHILKVCIVLGVLRVQMRHYPLTSGTQDHSMLQSSIALFEKAVALQVSSLLFCCSCVNTFACFSVIAATNALLRVELRARVGVRWADAGTQLLMR